VKPNVLVDFVGSFLAVAGDIILCSGVKDQFTAGRFRLKLLDYLYLRGYHGTIFLFDLIGAQLIPLVH